MSLKNKRKITSQPLKRSFYQNENVVEISQQLLGKVLVTKLPSITSGIIVETEAYNGIEDKASHAYNNRYTERTKTMYEAGGVAYIYLCYGLHHLFNVVTGIKGSPQAILIRAIEPLEGIEIMARRRKMLKLSKRATHGPGTLSQALGITTAYNGCLLTQKQIWIEDRGIVIPKHKIISGPRVGIDYAQEHKDLPWRFRVNLSKGIVE